MQTSKTSPDLNEPHPKFKDYLSPASVRVTYRENPDSKHAHSFSDLVVLSSLRKQNPTITSDKQIEVEQVLSGSVTPLAPEAHKPKYFSKVTYQERSSEISSGDPEVAFEDKVTPRITATRGSEEKEKEDAKNKKKEVVEEEKGKDGQERQIEEKKHVTILEDFKAKRKGKKKAKTEQKKDKNVFSNAFGIRKVKNTLIKLWGAKNEKASASGQQLPPFKAKSLVDFDLEANELNDHEKINQVTRSSKEGKQITHLGQSQQLDIGEEENPLSTGTLKIAMEKSMKPRGVRVSRAQTIVEGPGSSRGLRIPLEPVKADAHIFEEVVEEKEGTKSTVDATQKNPAVVKAEPFNVMVKRQGIKGSKKGQKGARSLKNGFLLRQIASFVGAALIGAFVFYLVLPLVIFFAVNDYGNYDLRKFMNFGFLGLIQGVVAIVLIKYIVDRPLEKRIKQIEGENLGLIDMKRYQLANWCRSICILVYTIGTQIVTGIVIDVLGYSVDILTVMLSLLCNSALGGCIWFISILIFTPTIIENKKKALVRDLQQIGEIRRNFLKELKDKKEQLDRHQNPLESSAKLEMRKETLQNLPTLGSAAAIETNLKVEVRTLHVDISEYSGELMKLRLGSIKIFGIVFRVLLHILVSLTILKIIRKYENVATELALLLVLWVIGTLFGMLEFFNSPGRSLLNTTKVINLISTAASYRFFFFIAANKGSMISAVILKFIYKFLAFYVPVVGYDCFKRFWKHTILKRCLKKHESTTEHHHSTEEKDLAAAKPLRLFLHEFTVIQNADLYFGLGTLTLLSASVKWLPGLKFDLGLRMTDSFEFYVGIVLIEAAIDAVLWIGFTFLAKKRIQKKMQVLKVSGLGEIRSLLKKRATVIIMFKVFILFIYLFIFMHEL